MFRVSFPPGVPLRRGGVCCFREALQAVFTLECEHVFNVFTLRSNTFVYTRIHLSSHTCEQSTYIFNMYNVTSPVQTTQREQTHGRPKILHKILCARASGDTLTSRSSRVWRTTRSCSPRARHRQSATANWSVYGKIKTQQRPPRPRRC